MIFFAKFSRRDANVTFAAKFMPQSTGYMLSYQVGQTTARETVTQYGKVSTLNLMILWRDIP